MLKYFLPELIFMRIFNYINEIFRSFIYDLMICIQVDIFRGGHFLDINLAVMAWKKVRHFIFTILKFTFCVSFSCKMVKLMMLHIYISIIQQHEDVLRRLMLCLMCHWIFECILHVRSIQIRYQIFT